jgi:acetolactate synthase-1/2/3 large subunit
MMAEAEGKLTGRPGILFVTRGPGAANASPGIHIARQDSTPLIVFVGQIDRSMREREAFRSSTTGRCSATSRNGRRRSIRSSASRRSWRAPSGLPCRGRPGPVVIALPEDMLVDTAIVEDAPRVEPVEPWPAPQAVDELGRLLAGARKPLVILGGARWNAAARDGMVRFAERFDLPVATSFRRRSSFRPITRTMRAMSASIRARNSRNG